MKAIYGSQSLRITDRKLLLAILFALSLGFIANFTASAQGPTPTDDDVNRIAKQFIVRSAKARRWMSVPRKHAVSGAT